MFTRLPLVVRKTNKLKKNSTLAKNTIVVLHVTRLFCFPFSHESFDAVNLAATLQVRKITVNSTGEPKLHLNKETDPCWHCNVCQAMMYVY